MNRTKFLTSAAGVTALASARVGLAVEGKNVEPKRGGDTDRNNRPFAWKGTLRLKSARIASGSHWMTGGKIAPCDALHLEINPHDVVVVNVRADKPLVVFAKDEGPEPTPAELERKSAALFAKLAGERRQ